MTRYEAGETLASIARTYDCSPPAISYVVSRSRARQPGAQPPPQPLNPAEPQLIKTTLAAADANGGGHAEPPPRFPSGFAHNDGERAAASANPAAPPPSGAAQSRAPAGHATADHRRTLHLSLGSNGHGNGGLDAAAPQPFERLNSVRPGQMPQPAPAAVNPPGGGRDAAFPHPFSERRPAAVDEDSRSHNGEAGQRKPAAGSFIDQELRARVDGDIAAFLAAFDAALVQDTQESRSALREATDRLLRVGARTRIELERLEARLPLASRDNVGRREAWRDR